MAGLFGAGHSSEMQVLGTMKDGQSCVISGPARGGALKGRRLLRLISQKNGPDRETAHLNSPRLKLLGQCDGLGAKRFVCDRRSIAGGIGCASNPM